MECPFELPVEAIEYKDACTRAPLKHKGIEANDGTTLVKLIWPSYADYIVQAINAYDSMKEFIEETANAEAYKEWCNCNKEAEKEQ